MKKDNRPDKASPLQNLSSNPLWALIAAFGTYFCMYGFRKPYTAATWSNASFFGIDYEFLLVISQTLGYVIAKWLGIKFVSEILPDQRIKALLALIFFAEGMLLLFGIIPRPWNILCLLLNGLPLGVVFGLVLGFLEGRKHTEALVAGLFFLAPILLFIAMLSAVPRPSKADIESRSERPPMKAGDRKEFFSRYAPGLGGIIIIYLLVTLLRSVRADFAPELWKGLGYPRTPALFTKSELWVSFGVTAVNGMAMFILSHFKAFRFSLLTCLLGFACLPLAVCGLQAGLGKFPFMVIVGLGVYIIYIPYVAVHTTLFERLICITKERANIGFLMYLADSVGYTGYIVLMFLRNFIPTGDTILAIFLKSCVVLGIAGGLIVLCCNWYFRLKLKVNDTNGGFRYGRHNSGREHAGV